MKDLCLASENGNIKLGGRGKVFSFSKLYGDNSYYSDFLGKYVVGSCGGFCIGCKKACYVRKSYRYKTVRERHCFNTEAMRNNLHKAFEDIKNQLAHKRVKPILYRINQSGEIESKEELLNWIDVAEENPTTVFYLYTKNYPVLESVVENYTIPSNIVFLVSIWHEFGIETYKRFSKYDCIKAFAYVDGFDYASHGIIIETMCHAYDENGKMNHKASCLVCKKCWNSKFKVIGCFDHS